MKIFQRILFFTLDTFQPFQFFQFSPPHLTSPSPPNSDFMAWIFFDVISITILKIKIIVKNIALRANKKLEKCVP